MGFGEHVEVLNAWSPQNVEMLCPLPHDLPSVSQDCSLIIPFFFFFQQAGSLVSEIFLRIL